MIAEVAAWAAEQSETLYTLLQTIYQQYGFYYEDLHSVTKKGKAGAEAIEAMMHRFRHEPPKTINGSPITLIKDYQSGISKDMVSGNTEKIDLPSSNVLQFFTEDGSKISVRPSGTEPKIKFYFGVKTTLKDKKDYDNTLNSLKTRIEKLKTDILAM